MFKIAGAPALAVEAMVARGLKQPAQEAPKVAPPRPDVGRLARLAILTVQFGLIVLVVRVLHIENRSFENVMTLAFAGFLAHNLLPRTWRLPAFAALSVTSILWVLGPIQGAWLLTLGGVLIALCHVPIRFGARVALVATVATALAVARVFPTDSSPLPGVIWPILGSMFMFRLIAYMYDLETGAVRTGPAEAISYFFMLPNVCFSLFPVIDYKTFVKSWNQEDAARGYATGTSWMIRGILQLLLYRWIYLHAVIDPASVATGFDALRYMLATYLLYLKISGLFHVIIGLLHMFGFALPESHHLYLLSSSFTDYWRRINIYWKDFIQKVVFNPCFFALRRFGEKTALGLATVIAFVATWLFHSYQWFWIRGNFPIVWSDIVFWLGLGAIVLVNVMIEAGRKPKRTLRRPPRTLRGDAILALKIAGTFAAILILWTIWSTPEANDLSHVVKGLLRSTPVEWLAILAVPLAMGVVGAIVRDRGRDATAAADAVHLPAARFWPRAVGACLVLLALIGVGRWPGILRPISPRLESLARDLRGTQLNAADTHRLQRGYYEDLGDVTRFNHELWAVYAAKPGDPETPGLTRRRRTDALGFDYPPSTSDLHLGKTRTFNSHGMRDREYALEPPPGVLRIAIVGASHDAGCGVGDDEVYEALVENRLNREYGQGERPRFEILNFSCEAYNTIQKLAAIECKALSFQPDVVLYVATSQEYARAFRSLQGLAERNQIREFPFLMKALEHEGTVPGLDGKLPPEAVFEAALAPHAPHVVRASIARARADCERRGIRFGLVFLPIPDDGHRRTPIFDDLARFAVETGQHVIDLSDTFADIEEFESLWANGWDHHTNAKGHAMIADRFYDQLVAWGLPDFSPAVREASPSQ